jgi:hypothetical protein
MTVGLEYYGPLPVIQDVQSPGKARARRSRRGHRGPVAGCFFLGGPDDPMVPDCDRSNSAFAYNRFTTRGSMIVPSGMTTTKNNRRSGPLDGIRKTNQPERRRGGPELLGFQCANLEVIKRRHELGAISAALSLVTVAGTSL